MSTIKNNINHGYASLFSKSFDGLETINIRPFRISEDCEFIHQWSDMNYTSFNKNHKSTLQQIRKDYIKLMEPEHHDVFVGTFYKNPIFVFERYNPKHDTVGTFYPVENGDIGIHITVAPPRIRIPNFTWYTFTTILDFVFQNPRVNRILVKPDIRNKKMFDLCQRIGFRLNKVVELPHKTAQLAFLTREHYQQQISISKINKRSTMNTLEHVVSPKQSVSHLQPQAWKKANTLLVRKAIAEFCHELLLEPRVLQDLENGWKLYSIQADNETIQYQFKAKHLTLNHYWVETASIKKLENDVEKPIDAVLFIKEFRQKLGIVDEKMPVYLEEIISTLFGSAYKLLKGNPTAKELVEADFQTIEQSMTEGHPGFVANNGRIGFDSSDYKSYAPEAGNSFSIIWVAGIKEQTKYVAIDSLPYKKLINQELDAKTIQNFNQTIKDQGYNPDNYYFIPTHPWQWFNKLANIYSTEIAIGNLICLGYGPDQYFAQQSIRTLFNCSNPNKFYTKTALSILNMGFMRGLPYYYLGSTPKMAVWLEDLLYNDPYIKETGFTMLSEIGSISYVNPYFTEFGPYNDFNKMLVSLWRESPMTKIDCDQQPMTMAALLHVDHNNEALLPKIIEKSGLTTEDWLSKYLKAYLSPLVHCFYHFDLVFMPHGENIIMVLENSIPVKALLKDITEEACILSPDVELPVYLKRMYTPVPEDVKLLSIFIDIFDGFFRYMVQILEEHNGFSEQRFWKIVAENIQEYQERYSQLQTKFEKYDLFAPDFHLSCLNRLQLNNQKQMIDFEDPAGILQFAGKLENPIAAFKKEKAVVNA